MVCLHGQKRWGQAEVAKRHLKGTRAEREWVTLFFFKGHFYGTSGFLDQQPKLLLSFVFRVSFMENWVVFVMLLRKTWHHQLWFTREPTGVNNYLYLQRFTEPLYIIHSVFSISGTADKKGEVSSALLQGGVISTTWLGCGSVQLYNALYEGRYRLWNSVEIVII